MSYTKLYYAIKTITLTGAKLQYCVGKYQGSRAAKRKTATCTEEAESTNSGQSWPIQLRLPGYHSETRQHRIEP